MCTLFDHFCQMVILDSAPLFQLKLVTYRPIDIEFIVFNYNLHEKPFYLFNQ
jgi:hypothetical protein